MVLAGSRMTCSSNRAVFMRLQLGVWISGRRCYSWCRLTLLFLLGACYSIHSILYALPDVVSMDLIICRSYKEKEKLTKRVPKFQYNGKEGHEP